MLLRVVVAYRKKNFSFSSREPQCLAFISYTCYVPDLGIFLSVNADIVICEEYCSRNGAASIRIPCVANGVKGVSTSSIGLLRWRAQVLIHPLYSAGQRHTAQMWWYRGSWTSVQKTNDEGSVCLRFTNYHSEKLHLWNRAVCESLQLQTAGTWTLLCDSTRKKKKSGCMRSTNWATCKSWAIRLRLRKVRETEH